MTQQQTRDPEAPIDPGCLYSEELPRLLYERGLSVAMTSFQANRLMLVRSDGEQTDVLFRAVPRPMGLAIGQQQMLLGSWAQVLEYRRQDCLNEVVEPGLPVDATYVPRSAVVTGNINIHDIAWGRDGEIWMVNSAFSCLATLDSQYNFVPRWKPDFITALLPQDRCHLNGMALRDGLPAFVTAFSRDDTELGWRSFQSKGLLMSVPGQQVLAEGLSFPHSPRWIDGWVYYCESGHGRVWRCRDDGSESTLVAELPGYTRGLDCVGSMLFIGLSRARASESAPPLPLMQQHETTVSGFWVIDLDTLQELGWLIFTGDVEQIYDVALIRGARFPHVMAWDDQDFGHRFEFPALSPLAEGAF